MSLNYIHGRNNVVTFHYQDRQTVYNAQTWNDYRRVLRIPFEDDFFKYGLVTGKNGNSYVINGEEIRNIAYNEDTRILIVTFKDESYLWLVAITNELGIQHKNYLTFVKDCNNLADVRRNRNIKVIASGADQTDVLFPSFSALQNYVNPGDYVIVEPGSYTLTDAFTFVNGVDIEFKDDVTINAQYSASSDIQYGVFVDTNDEVILGDLDQEARDEMADTTKIKTNRIFGNATVNILDCPYNRFMPIIRTYYNGVIYATFDSLTSNTGYGAALYAWNGNITARIKTIDTQRIIDNDYECSVCDMDSLTATITGNTFYPGTGLSVENPYAILRNCNVTNTANDGTAIESIAQGEFNYAYLHCEETADIFCTDTFANAGCNIYANNFKLETGSFTTGTQNSNWYNSGFTNTRNNEDDGGVWTYFEDSLTTV